jgi:Ca2+ transporting ATPase
MFKHIIGQAIYQIIVVCILTFAGPYFIPETVDVARDGQYRSLMRAKYPAGNFPDSYFPRFRDGNMTLGMVHPGNLRSIDGRSGVYQPIYEATK